MERSCSRFAVLWEMESPILHILYVFDNHLGVEIF